MGISRDDAATLGQAVLQKFQDQYKDAWNAFLPEEKTLFTACAQDAAHLTLRRLVGETGDAFDRQVAQTDAQLANFRAAAGTVVGKAVWSFLQEALAEGIRWAAAML